MEKWISRPTHSRPSLGASLCVVAVVIILSVKPALADDEYKEYAYGSFSDGSDNYTEENVLGARGFMVLTDIRPMGYRDQANLSNWVITDQTWRNNQWGATLCRNHVEVAYRSRCLLTGGCEGEGYERRLVFSERGAVLRVVGGIPQVQCAYLENDSAFYTHLIDKVADFVLIATDSTGEYWWGGISAADTGGTLKWYHTAVSKIRQDDNVTGDDGGHQLRVGSEFTPRNTSSFETPRIPVSDITGIEYTLSLGTGWGAWPSGAVEEIGHLDYIWKTDYSHGCTGDDDTEVNGC